MVEMVDAGCGGNISIACRQAETYSRWCLLKAAWAVEQCSRTGKLVVTHQAVHARPGPQLTANGEGKQSYTAGRHQIRCTHGGMGHCADGPVFERLMYGCGYAFGVVSAVALADTAVHVQPDGLSAATTA